MHGRGNFDPQEAGELPVRQNERFVLVEEGDGATGWSKESLGSHRDGALGTPWETPTLI